MNSEKIALEILKKSIINKKLDSNFERDVISQIETVLDDTLDIVEEKNILSVKPSSYIDGKEEASKKIFKIIHSILKNLGYK
jgi:hypothetical protein